MRLFVKTLVIKYHMENYVMKSTKVQTLSELRMRGTANGWAGLLVCVYSWFPASSSQRV